MSGLRSLSDYYRHTPFFLTALESRELFDELLDALANDDSPQVRRWCQYFRANWALNLLIRFEQKLDRLFNRAERRPSNDHPDAEALHAKADAAEDELARLTLIDPDDPPPQEVERPALLRLIDRLLARLFPADAPDEYRPAPRQTSDARFTARKPPIVKGDWDLDWGDDPARRITEEVRAPLFPREAIARFLGRKRRMIEAIPVNGWDPFRREIEAAKRKLHEIDVAMGVSGPTPALQAAYQSAYNALLARLGGSPDDESDDASDASAFSPIERRDALNRSPPA